ncbi:MAG: serine hydrolase domain-containing protein [bacterium]|nr:serine hydrolase domain-containing protein [bacterium]
MKKNILKYIFILIGIIIIIGIGILINKIIQLNKLSEMTSNEMIDYVINDDDKTIISVAIIKDDKIEYKTYSNNLKEDIVYDYEVGSISKTFVALLLSKTIEEGKIKINDSISKYLELDTNNYYPTIERLITHTSGYKGYYFNSKMIGNKFTQNNDYYGISRENILNKVKSVKLKDKDYKFEYSNFGISVIGLVLEKIYDKDFVTLMNEYIINDLKLYNTKVATSKGNLNGYWNWKADDGYIPAGAIISDIKDMSNYLNLYLESEESYITNTYIPIKDIKSNNYMYDKLDINMDKIAMTWMIDTENKFIWHNGATSNFNSYIAFNKEKKIGIILLSNLSPNKKIPMTVIGTTMMKELIYN